MKTKQFLIRTSDGGVTIADGTLLPEHSDLAIVKSDEMKLRFSIIDVASGLMVLSDSTKKKLLSRWETNGNTLLERIDKARILPRYEQRCNQLKAYIDRYKAKGIEVYYL